MTGATAFARAFDGQLLDPRSPASEGRARLSRAQRITLVGIWKVRG